MVLVSTLSSVLTFPCSLLYFPSSLLILTFICSLNTLNWISSFEMFTSSYLRLISLRNLSFLGFCSLTFGNFIIIFLSLKPSFRYLLFCWKLICLVRDRLLASIHSGLWGYTFYEYWIQISQVFASIKSPDFFICWHSLYWKINSSA
jgi:hypothetical protein